MPVSIRIPLALELLLVAIETTWPTAAHILPLGGGHCVQLGILLCFGIAAQELVGVLRRRGRDGQ